MELALKISGLKKTYDNGFCALKGIDLEVEQGDFFALLGPNGAGKSTTLGIVTSLVNKSAGHVSVFGHSIDTEITQAKLCMGIVPQEFNFNFFEKVEDIVVTQAGYYGMPRVKAKQRAEHYLRALGLWDKRASRARELSGGMKRRLMIARALVHDPKLLTKLCRINPQPSTRTKISNLNGIAIITGGIIIIPNDIRLDATTKSITRKGMKIIIPIWKAVLSSLKRKEGRATVIGTLLIAVGPLPETSKKKLRSSGRV